MRTLWFITISTCLILAAAGVSVLSVRVFYEGFESFDNDEQVKYLIFLMLFFSAMTAFYWMPSPNV